MKEAKTQQAFDKLSKLGEWFLVKSGHWKAQGQAQIEAYDQAQIEAYGQAKVVATSPYVSILAKSSQAQLFGGCILGNKSLTPVEWLSACNINIRRGKVKLFKSLEKDWTTQKGVSFKVGEVTIAPDWEANSQDECGKGLHFSPTVAQTKLFRDKGIFIACEVAVKDMADLPAFAEYPDKIRARACIVLYQVDEKGQKVKGNYKGG